MKPLLHSRGSGMRGILPDAGRKSRGRGIALLRVSQPSLLAMTMGTPRRAFPTVVRYWMPTEWVMQMGGWFEYPSLCLLVYNVGRAMDNISIVVRQPPAAIVVKGEPPSPRPSPRGGEGGGTNTFSPVGRGQGEGEIGIGRTP